MTRGSSTVANPEVRLLYSITQTFFFFFSRRRRHTRYIGDWSSDVCSSDLSRNSGAYRLGDMSLTDRIDQTMQIVRSEERRVGKECRSRGARDDVKKKSENGPEYQQSGRNGILGVAQ